MLEAELTAHLGYEPHAREGRTSGNSRTGKRSRKLRTAAGDQPIQVPRDRNSTVQAPWLEAHQTSTNELEDKIIALYARGVSVRDLQDTLHAIDGVELSPGTSTAVTDQGWDLGEAWQNRPLVSLDAMVSLEAIHLPIRRDGRVQNTAVYSVLDVALAGKRDVLGHWVGDGTEGATVWLNVITERQHRGVQASFLACIDGLSGFKDAIHAVFPRTPIQRWVIHQIRQSLTYVTTRDQKAFPADLQAICQAPTRAGAETNLLKLGEGWGKQYAIAVRSWEHPWDDLATMFDDPTEHCRLIYTTNTVAGYNRQLRKVTKPRGAFPTAEAARKRLYRGEAPEKVKTSSELMAEHFPDGIYCDIPSLCKVATLAEIEAQGRSSNPGRYVGVAAKSTIRASNRSSSSGIAGANSRWAARSVSIACCSA